MFNVVLKFLRRRSVLFRETKGFESERQFVNPGELIMYAEEPLWAHAGERERGRAQSEGHSSLLSGKGKVKEAKNNNPTLSIRSIEKEKGEGSSLNPNYMSGALHMITSFNTHNTVVGPFPPIFTHSFTRSKTTSSCSLPGTRKELVTKRQQTEILPTSYFPSNEEME